MFESLQRWWSSSWSVLISLESRERELKTYCSSHVRVIRGLILRLSLFHHQLSPLPRDGGKTHTVVEYLVSYFVAYTVVVLPCVVCTSVFTVLVTT